MARRIALPGPVSVMSAAALRFDADLARAVPELYFVGDGALLDRVVVAVVGSREPSRLGVRRAERLTRVLATGGRVVLSGLARGIDAVAHRTAIAAGGRTIAVVGTPLDRVYPVAHAELQADIARGHLLVSPFRRYDRTTPANFPLRNRVMVRLASACVIVEASDTSGTLHVAEDCVALGKPLFLPASVASDPNLRWPSRFLKSPTTMVLSRPEQVLGGTDALRGPT